MRDTERIVADLLKSFTVTHIDNHIRTRGEFTSASSLQTLAMQSGAVLIKQCS